MTTLSCLTEMDGAGAAAAAGGAGNSSELMGHS